MKPETWNAIGSVGTAIGAGFAILAFWFSRKTLQYQTLYDLQKEYRSAEMHEAVAELRAYARADPMGFQDRFKSALQDKPVGLELDEHRRLVTHFMTQLAVMYESLTVPRKAVHRLWRKDNLEIIHDVLLPLETAKGETIQDRERPIIPDDHPLWKLWYDSKNGYSWWRSLPLIRAYYTCCTCIRCRKNRALKK